MDEGRQAAAAALAKEFTGHAMSAGKDFAETVQEYIQKGPDGVSWLCFLGGMATSILGFLGFFDIFDAVVEPLAYLVNAYQMFFGLTACVLEAPKDWIDRSEKLKKAQEFIHEFARFLTTMGGSK